MKKAPILKTFTLAYLLFLYAPILLLPIFAFNNGKVVAFPLQGLYRAMVPRAFCRRQPARGAEEQPDHRAVGLYPFDRAGRLRRPRLGALPVARQGPVVGLIMLPLVLPEMIVAMALLVVLLSIGVPLSLFTIILGQVDLHALRRGDPDLGLPKLDRSLEEAALDLGETPMSTFRLIVLPLVMPGILASFLICFTISFDEFIIANFLGSGDPILSVYIFGQFRFPAKVPSMLALGTMLVCFSICLLAIAEYFRRRGIAKAGGKNTGGFL